MAKRNPAAKGKQKHSRSDVTDDSSSDEEVPGPSSRTTAKRKQIPKKSGSARRKTAIPSKKAITKPPTSTTTAAAAPAAGRFRPTKALAEIRTLQRSTKLCLRKQPFGRLVRGIQHRLNPKITHWQSLAIQALQEASEAYLVRFFEDCNMAANFSKRITIMQKDLQFIRRIRGNNPVG